MRKRTFLIIAVPVVSLLSFWFLKEKILLQVASRILKEKTGIEGTAQSLAISPASFQIKNLRLRREGMDFRCGKISIQFSLTLKTGFLVNSIVVESGELVLKKFSSNSANRSVSSSGFSQDGFLGFVPRCSLILKDISCAFDDVYGASGEIHFSFQGDFLKGRLQPGEQLSIRRFDCAYRDFKIEKLSLNKNHISGAHILQITKLVLKRDEVRDLFIPFYYDGEKIIFPRAHNGFFGPEAFLNGAVAFPNFQPQAASLTLENASLRNLIRVVNEDIDLEGLFSGVGSCVFSKGTLAGIQGDFTNNRGGALTVKKEASLDFLKPYLEANSYKALIANLQNYQYNKARIALGSSGKDITLTFSFDSEAAGKRTITVVFHTTQGGQK